MECMVRALAATSLPEATKKSLGQRWAPAPHAATRGAACAVWLSGVLRNSESVHLASFLRAVSKKSLISLICFGCEADTHGDERERRIVRGGGDTMTGKQRSTMVT